MRAIVLREFGSADQLKLEDWPRPTATAGHVVVRVRAAGVCYRDVVDRRGGFPMMKRPVVPGHEFAGDVVDVGADVQGLRAGDRVVNLHRAPCGKCEFCRAGHDPRCSAMIFSFGLTTDGGYAEYVAAPARCLVPLPAEIPYERACFLMCTAGVALRGLRTRAQLQAGETVLVTGASGGVGLHALQVAKLLGARTIGVTSSPAKADALRAHGADHAIVSAELAFHKAVKAHVPDGVDVALDCVGTPTLNASLRSVHTMGRVVVIGNVTTERAELNPGLIILSELSIHGSSGCSRADLIDVLEWARSGRLKPVLLETLPLEAAADAHRRMEARSLVGRLVLTP